MKTLKSLSSQCLKEPRLQPFQDLWESAMASFDSDHHQDAIEYLTTAVAEIEQSVLAVTLLKRAMAFSFQGKLQDAIKDVDKVMELAPTLFEGYLCAGSLLQLAGENSKALAVYKKGIGAVSGQCSEYEQIIRAKCALEDQLQKTNTMLFKKLPFELLVHIFDDLLSFEDRLQCMSTCRAWQDFLLEDLPQGSRRVILGTMPGGSMARLLQTISMKHHGITPAKGVQTHQVSILPGTSVAALENALNILSQDSWCGRIGYLDICADLDPVSNMKSMLGRLLQRNSESLKRVVICSIDDKRAAVDALGVCSSVSHLVVAAHHSLLVNNTSSVITRSGKKITNDGTSTNQVAIMYGRERIISAARREGRPNALTMSANPQWLAEQQYRALQQHTIQGFFPQVYHMALRRLELVGMEAAFFLYHSFWQRLPNLEHISIRDPVDHLGDLQSITRNISQYCPKLKTFRYGSGWQDTSCNENGIIPVVMEDAHEHEGLQEIVVRDAAHSKNVNLSNGMVVPNLLSGNKSYSALTVLILQMEAIGIPGLQTLTSLSLPRLTEFQLLQSLPTEAYNIQPQHFAPIASNFPALEKVVLIGVNVCDDALFELSKAQKLRLAHLRVGVARTTDVLNQRLLLQYVARVRALSMATRNARTEPTAAAPITHIFARGPHTPPQPFIGIMNLYTKFINNCTMLTEVCLSGFSIKDTDLHSLVTNNRNLSTVTLILCNSLTEAGIVSAFNCAGDSRSNIRHITFALMLVGGTLVSSLARLSSLNKLTLISCSHQNDSPANIASGLEPDPSRKSALEVYCVKTLTDREATLYACIPGQRSVLTRSVPSVPIIKPLADFL